MSRSRAHHEVQNSLIAIFELLSLIDSKTQEKDTKEIVSEILKNKEKVQALIEELK